MRKIIFDYSLTILGLIIISPLLLLIAVLVRILIGTPILFTQNRLGQAGQVFRIYKFRTMTNARDSDGSLLADAERLKPFGSFLRSSSLDELPELINVLRGDMSLVGPRPLLVEYLKLYSDEQFRRHDVKPGITGWAQINGRNALSWEKRFKLDIWYIENRSILLDIKIIILTFWKIVKRENISYDGHVTMKKFTGTK